MGGLWLPVIFGVAAAAQVAELGERLARDVRRQTFLLEDAAVSQAVHRIAGRIQAACPAEWTAKIDVIVADEVNGYALPGGYLFLNTGLIRKAGSEAELAGVLAHLIAQSESGGITMRTYASIPLVFLGGWSGLAYSPEGAVVPGVYMDAYRAAVLAADRRGAECMAAAGYDPREFVANLSRLPSSAERVEQLRSAIREPATAYTVDTSTFEEMKRRVQTPPRKPPSLQKPGQ